MTVSRDLAFKPQAFLKGLAVLAIVFGVATVISGGNVLFGPQVVQDMAGRFVPFVVWFNVVAGFFYIAAGLAILRGHRLALALSVTIAVATLLVAVGFGVWVIQGGDFEMRTVGALALRFAVWVAFSWAVFRARLHP
ncbi:hypothetical protein MWU54_08490 [Marivita sp. S6314]|uniref:hypothetical protein n=1 Tax=Marivita sp. S6314 TaxID=2926406 RepID=UPI001FF3C2A9|nr:hypothetical protein [Marivita sp. S6314]MCK0150055.1 hypothetical protein [Marivita sp. S6314]